MHGACVMKTTATNPATAAHNNTILALDLGKYKSVACASQVRTGTQLAEEFPRRMDDSSPTTEEMHHGNSKRQGVENGASQRPHPRAKQAPVEQVRRL